MGIYFRSLFVSDMVSILISLIILFGTLCETKVKDGRRKSLAITLIVNILFLSSEVVLSLLFLKDVDNLFAKKIACAVSEASSAIMVACFVNYIFVMLRIKGIVIKKIFPIVILVYNVLAVVSVIGVFADITLVVAENEIKRKGCYDVVWSAYYLCMVVLLVILFINRYKIGKHDFIVLINYFIFPILGAVFGYIHGGIEVIGLSGTIALLIVYITLQANIYDNKTQQSEEFYQAISSVYTTMHIINLKKGTFSECGARNEIHEFILDNKDDEIQELMWKVMNDRICEAHRDEIIKFVDLSTLPERMKGTRVVYTELITSEDRWSRFAFIRIGDINDELERVIYTSYDIDDTKRKERELIIMSNTDELTKIYNRHAFEEYVKELETSPIGDDLWYIIYDLNGLKIINDTKGHAAGDEMIIGIAKCLERAVANMGRTFRIGGDEFVTIIRGDRKEVRKILWDIDNNRRNWHGKYSNELSFSKGVVCSDEIPNCTMKDLEKEADERMYVEKKEYHIKYGVERRRN